MLAAGYKSVIAMMWSIMDDDAPLVATEVYSHLFHGLEPDTTRACSSSFCEASLQEIGGIGKATFSILGTIYSCWDVRSHGGVIQ